MLKNKDQKDRQPKQKKEHLDYIKLLLDNDEVENLLLRSIN